MNEPKQDDEAAGGRSDSTEVLERLLPCPFCGGAAERHVRNDILTVGCNSCLISFANHVRFGCRADAEWNMRSNAEVRGGAHNGQNEG